MRILQARKECGLPGFFIQKELNTSALLNLREHSSSKKLTHAKPQSQMSIFYKTTMWLFVTPWT